MSRAEGKDYLVLGFKPAVDSGAGRVHELSRQSRHEFMQQCPVGPGREIAHVPPGDTYFVVFRYGAVVLFQGHPGQSAPDQLSRPVVPPNHGPSGPWETDKRAWEDATARAAADEDSHLIYLLLRPFIRNVPSSGPVRPSLPPTPAPRGNSIRSSAAHKWVLLSRFLHWYRVRT